MLEKGFTENKHIFIPLPWQKSEAEWETNIMGNEYCATFFIAEILNQKVLRSQFSFKQTVCAVIYQLNLASKTLSLT